MRVRPVAAAWASFPFSLLLSPPCRPAPQYACSCCNSSHALSILRAYARATDDADMSSSCKQALQLLACRPCDPEVGTGAKPAVCRATCDSVFDACKEVGALTHVFGQAGQGRQLLKAGHTCDGGPGPWPLGCCRGHC